MVSGNGTRFSSKQLSGFFLSKSQSTTLCFVKSIQFFYFAFPCVQRTQDSLKLPKILWMNATSFIKNVFVPKLPATFVHGCVNWKKLYFKQFSDLIFYVLLLSRKIWLVQTQYLQNHWFDLLKQSLSGHHFLCRKLLFIDALAALVPS